MSSQFPHNSARHCETRLQGSFCPSSVPPPRTQATSPPRHTARNAHTSIVKNTRQRRPPCAFVAQLPRFGSASQRRCSPACAEAHGRLQRRVCRDLSWLRCGCKLANPEPSLFGFLFGSVLAGGAVYSYVLQEYKASNELLTEDIYVCLPTQRARPGLEVSGCLAVTELLLSHFLSTSLQPSEHIMR